MSELTNAERVAIHDTIRDRAALLTAVARIKADAHAAGVAEGRAAALWEAADWMSGEDWAQQFVQAGGTIHAIRTLLRERAALAGTSPQGEGERTHPLEIAHCPHRPFGICGACIPIGGPDPHDYRDDATAIGDS